MAKDMYDEKGFLKPEYELTDSQKREMFYNDNIEIIDHRTDYGKGIYYLTCDGKECATMEQVMQYNQMYYDIMMDKIDNHTSGKKEKHR